MSGIRPRCMRASHFNITIQRFYLVSCFLKNNLSLRHTLYGFTAKEVSRRKLVGPVQESNKTRENIPVLLKPGKRSKVGNQTERKKRNYWRKEKEGRGLQKPKTPSHGIRADMSNDVNDSACRHAWANPTLSLNNAAQGKCVLLFSLHQSLWRRENIQIRTLPSFLLKITIEREGLISAKF